MGKKLTVEYIRKYIESFGYKLLSTKYVNAVTKLKFICPEGHVFFMTWNNFQRGTRCAECFGNRKLTVEDVKKQITVIASGYKLLSTKYINSTTKMKFMCDKNHIFLMKWNHFNRGERCSKCNFGHLGNNIRMNIDFIRKEFNKENYSLITKNYIDSHYKLQYICKNGHVGKISWNDWKSGYRCKVCHYNNMRLLPNEAAKNQIYNSYNSNALRRNYKFELSKSEFFNIITKNCYYCGAKPNNVQKGVNNNDNYFYSGIDRIDNNIGYNIDNCVPCCKICNRVKSDLTYTKFIKWINNISIR